jgi:hypothetical protein
VNLAVFHGFHNIQEVSELAEVLLASEEQLWCLRYLISLDVFVELLG